jgi:PAS domain-containing protein
VPHRMTMRAAVEELTGTLGAALAGLAALTAEPAPYGGMTVMDLDPERDGQLVQVAPALADEFGYCHRALQGACADDYAHPDDVHELRATREALREGTEVAGQVVRLRTVRGTYARVRMHYVPLLPERVAVVDARAHDESPPRWRGGLSV